MFPARGFSSARDAQLAQRLTNNVNAAGDYHYRMLRASRQLLSARQCRLDAGFTKYLCASTRCRLLNLFGGGGARRIGMGGDDFRRQRKKDLRHFADGFIAHGAENKENRPLWEMLRKCGPQSPRPRRIVRHIENKIRARIASRNHLESSWPVGVPNTIFDMSRSHCEAMLVQLYSGGNRQSNVAALMHAEQWSCDRDRLAQHFELIRGFWFLVPRFQWHVFGGIHCPRAALGDGIADHIIGFRVLRQRHHNAARTDDAGFLPGDLRQRVSKISLV